MSRNFPLRQQWLGNVRGDVLAGIVVALALIPEAIAFSIIAGVDPKVGLYAAFCLAVVTSIAGGRPGMISAATGAMALLMVDLVKDHGVQYLLAASVLAGVLQLIAAALRLGALMRFVSRSVITGFVNALAILIFLAQLPELVGMPWPVYAVCAAALAIIYLLPRITTAIPSPLVAIVVLTAACAYWHLDLRHVGDMGHLPDSLPVFLLPDVPLTWDSVRILLPVSTTLAMVGLLESLMTAQIVEDLTDTPSQRNRECAGQGLANMVAGCFGGMAGCAMIGQSVINVRSGGRGRLSCLVAGVVLLLMVVYGAAWVRQIPMAALVAVMIMVSIGTFNWGSLRDLRRHPASSSVVMLGTVVVTVWTHDLARGVLVGVLLSALFFARKVGRMLQVQASDGDDGVRVYAVRGQVFFASAGQFVASFDFLGTPPKVLIDLSHAHFWDISAVAALDRVVLKLRAHGAEVEVAGLNQASDTLIETLGTHRRDGARLQLGH
ncbi:SulP family inorganic anion transporter [Xanthomonas phaseoli]|uniref:Sodium-independent anion transporter n=1 Tax=Xanthomonas phaseoli pv. dieffenbachiae TaxID=92828 RepID=A0A1V9H830_9XANT|nr:SulP family inorganic anion transporter [Xanthomonas phaseoli]MBO9787417.1 SulP family inorganic anion transporter [Xanthomonas phaseoli pv. dieffenbachiae]MBO9831891.1 SulP family inorganic anion transporter [Xanthomonas phaseoli pv. dieffenbachiae]MBO9835708.1 SulP family inorganic anion transporter [Xanthomonas phaseoli pv. dieffenbachiae]MBO9840587.1 SulP family inorganic anion transporter [Xanthomonas phaseoli pv. dieffenbachiae]MBO9851314.1 SulP family inorganic anion transporter [Xan